MWGIRYRCRPGAAFQPRHIWAFHHCIPKPLGGGGRDHDVVACFRDGVLNVMKRLGMTNGDLNRRHLRHHLVGVGNLDSVTQARVDGFFQREAASLATVRTGQHWVRSET